MKSPVRPRRLFVSLLTTASLTIVNWATAVTVNLAPAKDNTLIETPIGNSNGAGDGIYVGGVLAFDLSSIPTSLLVNLSYTLPRASNVSIAIVDIKSRVVRRLVSRNPQLAGVHQGVWDGRTDSGRPAPSGLYLASLLAGDTIHHRRIPLVR